MPLKTGAEMPSLDGATEWFGATEAHALAEAQGHPTLVHFWSIGCRTCVENMPRLAGWRDGLRNKGLRFIAVHVPGDKAEMDTEAVRDCIAEYNITEPCAVDNEQKLRRAFLNEQGQLPAYYLFDAGGRLLSFAAGENSLDKLASALEHI